MARVTGLGHVGIYVLDLERMVAFYRDVMQPRAVGGTDLERRAPVVARRERAEVGERDAMVLVVVRDEAEVRVLVDHSSPERRAVPVAHLRHPVGLEHDVGELRRGHGMVLLDALGFPGSTAVNGIQSRCAAQESTLA